MAKKSTAILKVKSVSLKALELSLKLENYDLIFMKQMPILEPKPIKIKYLLLEIMRLKSGAC